WPTGTGGLPGYGSTVTVLFAAQIGLLALLAVVAVAQRAPGQYLGGLAGPLVASLGLGVAAMFTAGVSYRIADSLNRGTAPIGDEQGSQVQLPQSLQWASFGMAVGVLVILLVALGAWLILLPVLRRRARTTTDDDHPDGRAADKDRAKKIDRAIANAR